MEKTLVFMGEAFLYRKIELLHFKTNNFYQKIVISKIINAQ